MTGEWSVPHPDLEAVFREYADFVYRICHRYARDRDEAEDLTQEVFCLLSRKLKGFKGQSKLGTWLYRITVNECLQHLLDFFLQGDLGPDEMEGVRKGLEADPDAVRYLLEAREKRFGRSWAHIRARLRPPEESVRSARRVRLFPVSVPRWLPARAGLAVVCLALAAGVWYRHAVPPAEKIGPSRADFVSKGMSAAVEARLDIAGLELKPGGIGKARPGDRILLEYRSLASGYARVRIQADDGNALEPGSRKGIPLEPATRWRRIPVDFPVGMEWSRIRVWVLFSSDPWPDAVFPPSRGGVPPEGPDQSARFEIEVSPASD